MFEWHIQARSRHCQVTQAPFNDGDLLHTVLLSGRGGLERLDLGEAAWRQEGKAILSRPGYISHWVGTFHVPPAAPPEPIRKGDAEALLRVLVEKGDPADGAVLFILAAMLERKRVLRLKRRVGEQGQRKLVYEHPKAGDLFVIPDPDLQLDQLEAVQQRVADLLEHGLPESTPAGGEARTEGSIDVPPQTGASEAAGDGPESVAEGRVDRDHGKGGTDTAAG